MKTIDYSKFQFSIYSKEAISTLEDSKIDQIYQFWHQIWSDTYAEIGKPELLKPDLFLRQNYIAALLYNEEVIGCHFYEVIDVRKFLYSNTGPSIEILSPGFNSTSIELKKNLLMILTQLGVSKQWRRSICGLNIVEALIMTATYFAQNRGYSACAGTTRNSKGVNKIYDKGSTILIEKDYMLCGEPSDVLIFDIPFTPNVDTETKNLALNFWNTLQLDGQYLNRANELKIA